MRAFYWIRPPTGSPLGTRAGIVRSNVSSLNAPQKRQQVHVVIVDAAKTAQQRVELLAADVGVAVAFRACPVDVVVEVEHILERRKDAAVHVRRGEGEVAQRRGPERVAVFRAGVRRLQLRVVGNAKHVQLEVGEHRAAVTVAAADPLEPPHPAKLRGVHRAGVAAHVAVERGAIGGQRPLEGRQRARQVL